MGDGSVKSNLMKYNNLSEVQIQQLKKITDVRVSSIAWGEPTDEQRLKTGLICATCFAILVLDIQDGMLYIMKEKKGLPKVYFAIARNGKSHAQKLGLEHIKAMFEE